MNAKGYMKLVVVSEGDVLGFVTTSLKIAQSVGVESK